MLIAAPVHTVTSSLLRYHSLQVTHIVRLSVLLSSVLLDTVSVIAAVVVVALSLLMNAEYLYCCQCSSMVDWSLVVIEKL